MIRIFRTYQEIRDIPETVCALGNFDGVHLGHKAILETAVRIAKEKGLVPAVFTFTSDPVNVIAGKTVVKEITDLGEKAAIMEELGIELLFALDFNDMMRTSPAECFCRYILSEMLNVREAVCGFNYRFAYKAEGTPETLAAFGKELGYGVTVVPEVKVCGTTVSSTLLRECVEEGRMEDYAKYAGRSYSIAGTVVEGRRIGRTIGFPTVNLDLSPERALPPNGVYITKTYVNETSGNDTSKPLENTTFSGPLPSVTNVGNKPTIGVFEKNAETHILDFSGDLYGADIRVEFLKMTRPERRFDGLGELREQIARDKDAASAYFGRQKVL